MGPPAAMRGGPFRMGRWNGLRWEQSMSEVEIWSLVILALAVVGGVWTVLGAVRLVWVVVASAWLAVSEWVWELRNPVDYDDLY